MDKTMPIFEWTISVGNIATAIVFVVGIGVYLGKMQAFQIRALEFFKESKADRGELWKSVSRMHSENRESLDEMKTEVREIRTAVMSHRPYRQ